MKPRRLAVVAAGLSQPSSSRMLAERLAQATKAATEDLGGEMEVEVIELRDHAHELTNNLLTGFADQNLRRAMDTVVEADGLIAVSPIFSASYTGLFKTFFDVLESDSLAGKPVLIGATAGTARHSLALEHAIRPLFIYLRAVVVPTAVFAATEDWGSGASAADRALSERIDRAGRELASLVASTDARRPNPYEDVTPFEQMLGGRSD
jgi:FMN reductase